MQQSWDWAFSARVGACATGMLATPYTLTAVPARIALELRRWAEVAAIEPRTPADYPWECFPAVEAISHLARALGEARSGERERAREAVERLAALRDQAAETSEYCAQQVEVQRRAGTAGRESLAQARKYLSAAESPAG